MWRGKTTEWGIVSTIKCLGIDAFSIILCVYGLASALTAHDFVLETSISIVKNGIAGDCQFLTFEVIISLSQYHKDSITSQRCIDFPPWISEQLLDIRMFLETWRDEAITDNENIVSLISSLTTTHHEPWGHFTWPLQNACDGLSISTMKWPYECPSDLSTLAPHVSPNLANSLCTPQHPYTHSASPSGPPHYSGSHSCNKIPPVYSSRASSTQTCHETPREKEKERLDGW